MEIDIVASLGANITGANDGAFGATMGEDITGILNGDVTGTSGFVLTGVTDSTLTVDNFGGKADVIVTYHYDPIPEPASLSIIALGGLMMLKRRRLSN